MYGEHKSLLNRQRKRSQPTKEMGEEGRGQGKSSEQGGTETRQREDMVKSVILHGRHIQEPKHVQWEVVSYPSNYKFNALGQGEA